MFKIQWNDTKELTMVDFATAQEALAWGEGWADDYTVIEMATGKEAGHNFKPRSNFDFMNVGGMTYAEVRRMGRE